jgi:hypothetical protein
MDRSRGVQGGPVRPPSDGERDLYRLDMKYFHDNPATSDFVRRVSPVDLEYLSGFLEHTEAWSGVEWVLVIANPERTLRTRVPLRAGDPQLTDGHEHLGWLAD